MLVCVKFAINYEFKTMYKYYICIYELKIKTEFP